MSSQGILGNLGVDLIHSPKLRAGLPLRYDTCSLGTAFGRACASVQRSMGSECPFTLLYFCRCLRLTPHGAVQGSHLGLEIDVSTFRSVRDTSRRSKACSRHFWVVLTCFTHCLRVVYFPYLAQPRTAWRK